MTFCTRNSTLIGQFRLFTFVGEHVALLKDLFISLPNLVCSFCPDSLVQYANAWVMAWRTMKVSARTSRLITSSEQRVKRCAPLGPTLHYSCQCTWGTSAVVISFEGKVGRSELDKYVIGKVQFCCPTPPWHRPWTVCCFFEAFRRSLYLSRDAHCAVVAQRLWSRGAAARTTFCDIIDFCCSALLSATRRPFLCVVFWLATCFCSNFLQLRTTREWKETLWGSEIDTSHRPPSADCSK